MSADRPSRRPLLSLEGLETRCLPSSTPILIEPFETPRAGGLPGGWSQWSGNRAPAFAIDKYGGLGDLGELASAAPTGVAARAWVTNPFQADVETTAAVYVNSLVPAQLFV